MSRTLRSQRAALDSKPEQTIPSQTRSPLKDTPQNASQRNTMSSKHITGEASVDAAMEDSDDDEILLSPKKLKPNSKRPPSPPDVHGLAAEVDAGRVAKRFKLDPLPDLPAALKAKQTVALDKPPQRRGHVRNFSAPNITETRRKTRSRSATTVTKPASTTSLPDEPPSKGAVLSRAQSVPLFKSETYVYPDFTNIRPSPWRALSVEREGRYNQIVATRLDSILDLEADSGSPMETDKVQEDVGVMMEVDDPSTVAEPTTPRPQSTELPPPSSPLTPVPETPLPTLHKRTESTQSQETACGVVDLSTMPIKPVPAPGPSLAPTRTSKLPRPSVGMGPPPVPQLQSQIQPSQLKQPLAKLPPPKHKRGASKTVQNTLDRFLVPKTAPATIPSAVAPSTAQDKPAPQPRAGPSKPNATAVATTSLLPPPPQAKSKIMSKMKKREKAPTSYTALPEAPTTVTRTVSIKKPKRSGVRKDVELGKEGNDIKMADVLEETQEVTGHTQDNEMQLASPTVTSTTTTPDIVIETPILDDSEQLSSVTATSSVVVVAPKRVSHIPAPSPKKSFTFTFPLPPSVSSSSFPKSDTSSGVKTRSAKGVFPKAATKPTEPEPAPVPEPRPNSKSLLTEAEISEPPGSPMQISSPAKPMSAAPSPSKPSVTLKVGPRHKRSLSNPNSPTKPLVRPTQPRNVTFEGVRPLSRGPSSLSTLSDALEKLTRAAPSKPNTGRPSTSMGFNRDFIEDDEGDDKGEGGSTRRSATTEDLPGPTSGVTKALVRASLSRPLGTGNNETGEKATRLSGIIPPSKSFGKTNTLTSWMANGGLKGTTAAASSSSKIFMASNGTAGLAPFKGLGVAGGRLGQKASKKTALPSVMASPTKGGNSGDNMEGTVEDEWAKIAAIRREGQSLAAKFLAEDSGEAVEDEVAVCDDSTKGKAKETNADAWKKNASRRASLALQGLSQSLSMAPSLSEEKDKTVMGPPATPTRLGTPQSPGSPMGLSSSATKATGLPVRSSSRIAAAQQSAPAALSKIKGGSDGHVSSSRKAKEDGKEDASSSLKILKDCKVFVDVRTDDGDDAGSLFVEMLDSLGAKMMTRVGQTCTHIVYKNGLLSTQSRYRMLREPKPLVVGITWVVECAEQMKRVDESPYSIDLESINVAGIKSRRRFMFPKTFHQESDDTMVVDDESDISMEGSSSMVLDGLAPLERARRRQSLMIT